MPLKFMNFDLNLKKSILRVTPEGYLLRQSFRSWRALNMIQNRSYGLKVIKFSQQIGPKKPKCEFVRKNPLGIFIPIIFRHKIEKRVP